MSETLICVVTNVRMAVNTTLHLQKLSVDRFFYAHGKEVLSSIKVWLLFIVSLRLANHWEQ